MAKLFGHSLSKTQTQAAIVSAAAGLALLAVAVVGMRKGGATAGVSGDDLNVAFKQGYNAGATDTQQLKAATDSGFGPWDGLPSASPSAPIATSTPSSQSAPAPIVIQSAPVQTTTRTVAAPTPTYAYAAPAAAPKTAASAPAAYSDRAGNKVTLEQLLAQPFQVQSAPAPVVRDPENPYYRTGYQPAPLVTQGAGSGGGALTDAIGGPLLVA